ncbi:fructoselysine 6-kinase [Oceanobacillus aidingensis]|uniref:Fructoselysine 6-kinase n=1 Tax=Oceanobacillus aidingensis TaxID=645964 RepID=A0ABV9JSJ0_9BACI
MRVAGVGLSIIDVYEEQNKSYPTGNSVDFLVHLSRKGIDTAMSTVVGTDKNGELMLTFLKNENIDTSHIKVREGSTAIFKMELKNNERIHKEKIEGVMEDFFLTEEDINSLSEYDYIHTNFSGRAIEYLSYFKERGTKIIFDFSVRVSEEFFNTLKYIDYAFFSYTKDDAYIRNFMKNAQLKGPELVVVTLGERGSIAYDGNEFYKGNIVPTTVVNTVGAGDSFCSGFIFGVIHNKSIERCLEIGAEFASKVVSKFEPY